MGDDFDASQFVFESPLVTLDKSFAAYPAPSFERGGRCSTRLTISRGGSMKNFNMTSARPLFRRLSMKFWKRAPVCQDFAHLIIACLRSLELPVRYISGYFRNDASLAGAEASHAWISAWCPVLGCQGFDTTNNTMPGGRHLTLAWGRDYSEVTPVKGVALGGGEHVISVSVDVSQLADR